jgi:hypothetical protein
MAAQKQRVKQRGFTLRRHRINFIYIRGGHPEKSQYKTEAVRKQ